MKLQYLTASALVLSSLVSLACSSGNDDIFMGGDGSGGSSGGSKEPGGAGTASSASGAATGGTGMGGGSSSDAGTGMGGGSSSEGGTGMGGGESSGGTANGGGAGYEPCAGKACGDPCSPCGPQDANCIAPAVEMTCTASGQCTIGRPACTIPSCEGEQEYYAPGCNGMARPNPNALLPFDAGCYEACSNEGTCPDGFSCVSVWSDPSAGCAPGAICPGVCGAVTEICIAD